MVLAAPGLLLTPPPFPHPRSPHGRELDTVCVYYCSTYYKAGREGGGWSGGHVLRETASRGLCELVCPSRTRGPVG